MIHKPKVSFVLYKQHKSSDGRFPIKIKIYFNGQKKHFSVKSLSLDKTHFTVEEFEKIKDSSVKLSKRNAADIKLLNSRNIIIEQQLRLQSLAESIRPFSFELLKNKIYNLGGDYVGDKVNDVYYGFEEYMNYMKRNNKLPYIESMQTTLKHLRNYHKTNELPFQLVTTEFLYGFEEYLFGKKTKLKSSASVAIYMRNIRTVFNYELDKPNSSITRDNYPFGKRRYRIKEKRILNSNKSLKKEEVNLIKEYKTNRIARIFARDMWLLSYYGNGMNGADILKLKYGHLEYSKDCAIVFFNRQKTETTAEGSPPIRFFLTKEDLKIIDRHGNKDNSPDNYIFKGLHDNITADQKKLTINNFNSRISNRISKIAEDLEIEKKVTAETARHSFASVLRKAKISKSEIGELMGHQNTHSRVTDFYLDEIDEDRLKYIRSLL